MNPFSRHFRGVRSPLSMKRRKDVKARRARTHKKREALNRPGVFPDHRHGNNHHRVRWMPSRPRPPEMLTFHNISQHFREIDARLRRIPGDSEIDPLREPSKPSKPIILWHCRRAATFIIRLRQIAILCGTHLPNLESAALPIAQSKTSRRRQDDSQAISEGWPASASMCGLLDPPRCLLTLEQ
jgi:hypothetical protein